VPTDKEGSTPGHLVHDLVPFAHVADVARSIAFYARLGFAVEHSIEDDGVTGWAFLRSGDARQMVAQGTPFDPGQQAVLFYLYSRDVAALRERLVAASIRVGPIGHPDHMPDGEIRIDDPDGYCCLIGQLATGPDGSPRG